MFDRIADAVAPIEEALLARAITALDLAKISETDRADAQFGNAAAMIDQVAKTDGDRPARYQAAFALTQLAAEAGRWQKAEVFLKRLTIEAPIIDRLDIPATDRDAVRRSERWLAGVVANRVFETLAN